MSSKLFKVIYGDKKRPKKIAIVANCLAELQMKSKKNLNIEEEIENLSVCLEDGTEIIDDESFQFLETGTVLKILDGKVTEELQKDELHEPNPKLNVSGSSDGKPKKKKSKIEEFNDAVIECKGNYDLLVSRASSIITDQEKDNTKYEAVLRIIALRSKMESFVQKNYPKGINKNTNCTIYGKPEKLSYCDALNEIILSKDVRFTADEFIVMIRKQLDEFGIEPKIFMKFARWLYSEFSDSACHKMVQFAPPLPVYKDTEAIENILSYVQIDLDVPAIQCIQFILKPLEMPTGNVVP